ncbi:MAG: SUMF1/EgtB/PvdO family nonheme iron enzyme [Magnetococcales bacterium]|nr:SUMF1/EgtB/PvdO family nonheme iron enzyme [Magnetococcales bacterium]
MPSLTPVGLYPAGDGPLGHCDLAGNVWEWQRNLGKDGDATTDMPPDPVVTEADKMAVRGGSWLDSATFLQSAYRNRGSADGWGINLGFRVAAAPSSTLDL